MRHVVLTPALLLGLLGLLAPETVEVRPGEDVTLLCSNFSSAPAQVFWFRLVWGSEPRCVSSMFKHHEAPRACEGFPDHKYDMSSNASTLFLRVKRADPSDSGLYFCGYHLQRNPVMMSTTFMKVQVSSVQSEEPDQKLQLVCVTLGGLTGFLFIVLLVVLWSSDWLSKKRRSSQDLDESPPAPRRHPGTAGGRRPAPGRGLETRVLYTTTGLRKQPQP